MTIQTSEILIWNNDEFYLERFIPLPEYHSNLRELQYEEIDFKSNSLLGSTACYRNYIGTWLITNNKFYLKNIVGRFELIDQTKPIHADWFSGTIEFETGAIVPFIKRYNGFPCQEFKYSIKINKGIVIDISIENNFDKVESKYIDNT